MNVMRAEEELTGLLTTMTDPNWRPVGEEEAATWNHLDLRRSKGPRGQSYAWNPPPIPAKLCDFVWCLLIFYDFVGFPRFGHSGHSSVDIDLQMSQPPTPRMEPLKGVAAGIIHVKSCDLYGANRLNQTIADCMMQRDVHCFLGIFKSW